MNEDYNATRYFCAAAQTDTIFRQLFLKKILDEEYRFISVSPGINLTAIAKHCLDAKRRNMILNTITSVLLVIAAHCYMTGHRVFQNNLTPEHILSSTFSFTYVYCFLGILVAYFFESYFTIYQIIGKRLSIDNCDYDYTALVASKDKIVNKLSRILDDDHSNVVIYSGYSPFVGSGINIGGWSFTLNINKGREEINGEILTPESFTIEELYNLIDRDIKNIKLGQTKIQDKIFVNGKNIRGNKKIFPENNLFCRPVSQLEESDFKELINNGDSETVRYYKCIRIIGLARRDYSISLFTFCKTSAKFICRGKLFFAASIKTRIL